MSDLMLLGVLRMPLELHLADDVFGPPQLQSRMLQAADELERRADRIAELERENEALRKDAERLDHIEKNARCDPKMDGMHVWWPTTFNHRLIGPNLRAAIDAAIGAEQMLTEARLNKSIQRGCRETTVRTT